MEPLKFNSPGAYFFIKLKKAFIFGASFSQCNDASISSGLYGYSLIFMVIGVMDYLSLQTFFFPIFKMMLEMGIN